MQLAILHHHLNRGGVSQVIANHLRALATLPAEQRPERVLLLHDGQRDSWPADPLEGSGAFPIVLAEATELHYDEPGDQAEAIGLAEILQKALVAQNFKPEHDLLHVHNHALGKKASLPGALRILAEDGWRMLLQVHDFAEDNRPANYRHLADAIGVSDPHQLGQVLYPQAANIHYATLTERDAVILEGAGVPPERLHTLPNPIAEFGEMPAQDEARSRVFPLLDLSAGSRLIVYPVRGIRRKNLGEMLLLAALAPEGTYFALTLAPKNPVEAVSFNRWRQLAEELELPCLFNSGGPKEEDGYGCDFKETLAAADAILTTSVAEGFGMVFLEAWLAGKPLIGRDLPEITREFKAAGLSFNGLWEELLLPSNTFDASAEDFGRLAPTEQIEVVIKTAGSQLIQEKFREANPRLAERLTTCASSCLEEINRNADVVREAYSTHRLGEHIRTTYGSLLSSIAGTCSGLRRGEKIFSHFNKPENLWPVRTEECLKN